ncbi:unnamed protein product [Macrosiphum euphorbiae]|uniref:Uncharacterized protein n=1 Tax=Macrosiphum euphorbiae TaxID=13131 RepID=A0AAV0X3H7_9HEMI|nr:unnamed protein product [Macrosiphum euphorbiae]
MNTSTSQLAKRMKKKSGRNANKISKIDSSLDNAVETLRSVCKLKATTNEFNVFGNHVAAQLEKLPLRQALVCQEKIQSMLTSARLNMISRPLSPVSSEISQTFDDDYDVLSTDNDTIEIVPRFAHPINEPQDNAQLYYNNWTDNDC